MPKAWGVGSGPRRSKAELRPAPEGTTPHSPRSWVGGAVLRIFTKTGDQGGTGLFGGGRDPQVVLGDTTAPEQPGLPLITSLRVDPQDRASDPRSWGVGSGTFGAGRSSALLRRGPLPTPHAFGIPLRSPHAGPQRYHHNRRRPDGLVRLLLRRHARRLVPYHR